MDATHLSSIDIMAFSANFNIFWFFQSCDFFPLIVRHIFLFIEKPGNFWLDARYFEIYDVD